MMTVAASIFIIHQSERQVRIWQKILQSQGLKAIALPFSTDLRGQLMEMEDNNQALPSLILLEQQLPSFDTDKFLRWMQTFANPVPIILLAKQARKVENFDRDEAINAGALDILPKFEVDTIAIEAVNGLKCVAKALGNIRIVNNTLVTCIMEIKREIEAELYPEAAVPKLPSMADLSQQARDRSALSPKVTDPNLTDKTKIRKYRGRDY